MAIALGVHAQPSEIQKHQRDAAHHEAGQTAREAQLHEELHHRLQQKRDDRGDDDRNEEHTPVVQQGDRGARPRESPPPPEANVARTYWERTLAYHYNWTDVDFQANSDKRRILALDLGKKRIGLALSDPLGITAQGLPTLQRTNIREDLAALAGLIEERDVGLLLMGHPLHMSGREGRQADYTRDFAERLAARTGLPCAIGMSA